MVGRGVAVVACAVLQTGCFAIAVGGSRNEHISSSVVETRVSRQQANISGSLCYVDQRVATTSRTVIPSYNRAIAGAEILLGGLTSFFGAPAYYVGLPAMVDGIVSAIYIKGTDEKMSTTRSWEVSNETAGCSR